MKTREKNTRAQRGAGVKDSSFLYETVRGGWTLEGKRHLKMPKELVRSIDTALKKARKGRDKKQAGKKY